MYLRSRTGLSSAGFDNSLRMQAAQVVGGAITRAKFEEFRGAWTARNMTVEPQFRWVDGYAIPAETAEDALAALAAKPDLHPLISILHLLPSRAEPVGRVYSLGHREEGTSYLVKASTSCAILDGSEAIFSTWASFDLGRALEERHDRPEACAAYQRVLDRWSGAATSRTAFNARVRRRGLHCAP
jgi:hypothetical protein